MEALIHKIRAIAFNYGTEEMRLIRNITDEMLQLYQSKPSQKVAREALAEKES